MDTQKLLNLLRLIIIGVLITCCCASLLGAQGTGKVTVKLEPYGKDLTDGTIGGVFSLGGDRYYVDDQGGRRNTQNVYFSLAYEIFGEELNVVFSSIGTFNIPMHTLEVGAKVTLTGATFASGARETTVKGFAFSGAPPRGPIRKSLKINIEAPEPVKPEPVFSTSTTSNSYSGGLKSMVYYEDLAERDLPQPQEKTKSLTLNDHFTLGAATTSYKPHWNIFLQAVSFSSSDYYLPLGIKFDLGRVQWASESADSIYFYKFYIDPLLCYFTYRLGAKETSAFQLSLGGSPLSFNAYESYQDSTYRTGEKFWKPFLDAYIQFAFPLGKKLSERASILSLKVGYCTDLKDGIWIENQSLESRKGAYLTLSCGISGLFNLQRGIPPGSQSKYAAQIHQRALELQAADVKAARDAAEPCDLTLEVTFDDDASYFPDNALESTESAVFNVKVKNAGVGPGYDTKVTALLLDNPKGVKLDRTEVGLGEIPGKNGIKECSFTISAAADLTLQATRVLFRAVESRGFYSRDYSVELPLRPIALPDLAVLGPFTVQDGTDGYASGNGNGVIENGETVELSGFVVNRGKGPSTGAQVQLTGLPTGVRAVVAAAQLGQLDPSQKTPVRFAFSLPADFATDKIKQLNVSLSFSETRDVKFTPYAQTLTLGRRQTRLVATLDAPKEMENGNEYTLTLRLANQADLAAENVTVSLQELNGVSLFPTTLKLQKLAKTLPSSNTVTVTIPRNYSHPELNITVRMEQAVFGAQSESFQFPVRNTAPRIVVNPQMAGNFSATFNQAPEFWVELYNSGDQLARGLEITASSNHPQYSKIETQPVGDLSPNKGTKVQFKFSAIPRGVKGGAITDKIDLPISISVKERDFSVPPKVMNVTVYDDPAIATKLQAELPVQFTGGIMVGMGTVATGTGAGSSDEEVDIPPVTKMSNPDAVAVIIGNRDYRKYHTDSYNVDFAQRDAAVMKDYLIKTLGFKESNIISKTDADISVFQEIFGTENDPVGTLNNRVKPGKSDVFVYYSGHGAPDIQEKRGYFVPVNCAFEQVSKNGYPLDLLYDNLEKIPASSFTIVIDACFSGNSQKGMLIASSSLVGTEILNRAMKLKNSVVFTSSSGTEISSWYPEKEHGLFTYFFLRGLKGAGDLNGDRKITAGEMQDYLTNPSEGVPFLARTLYNGRQQNPEMQGLQDRVLVEYK